MGRADVSGAGPSRPSAPPPAIIAAAPRDRQQRDPAGERDAPLSVNADVDHRRQPRPAEPAVAADPLAVAAGDHGQQAADAEFPHPRGGHEVGRRRVGPGVVDRVGERAGDERGRQQGDRDQPGPSAVGRGALVPTAAAATRRRARPGDHDRDQRRDAEQQRPDQVELLLDGQRPEVLDRGGGPGGLQVVDRVARELPVLEVQRARPDLRGDVGELGDRLHHPGDQPGDEQHEGGRRHQPPGPAAPEVEQRHRSRSSGTRATGGR